MAIRQTSVHCPHCRRYTLHQKEVFSQSWGCLLTILTAGLFIPFWLLGDLLGILSAYRCQTCGRRTSSPGGVLVLLLLLVAAAAVLYFALQN